MSKHCMDCGLKMTTVDEKHKPVRYECAVCNAYWVHTIKVASTWEKFPIENGVKGFRIQPPSAEHIINEARKTSKPLTADTIRKVADLYLKDMPLDPQIVTSSRELMESSITANKKLQHELGTSAKGITQGEFNDSLIEVNARILKQAEEVDLSTKIDELIDDHKSYLGHND